MIPKDVSNVVATNYVLQSNAISNIVMFVLQQTPHIASNASMAINYQIPIFACRKTVKYRTAHNALRTKKPNVRSVTLDLPELMT